VKNETFKVQSTINLKILGILGISFISHFKLKALNRYELINIKIKNYEIS